ncbi:cytochrome c oxidase subunit II [Acidimangrovimonas sediminis]|uniref:cytochrome c oxidase subunit II n=1 Tax=Acidimangrovimonas sediminis TaxID=2056283 RepID=UPI000C8084DC|nr:cytochrome c oxidase subunit II [Acidimangrovimonas sediminis]
MRNTILKRGVGALSILISSAAAAVAEDVEIIGQPRSGMTGFQPASTPVAHDLQWLDGMMTVVMAVIVVFVTCLLLYVIFRFRAGRNVVPARFTHNTPLEVAWTMVPVAILVMIGAFSLPTLFKEMEIPRADVTIKVTGNQWFWSYEYPEEKIAFDSYMIGSPASIDDAAEPGVKPYILNAAMEEKLKKAGYSRDQFLLATTNPVVVPVGKTVVVKITGADVIHSWALPAFGVKQDAVPGRLAEAWFKVDKPGVYFGQCSELCGKDHSYMPIEVHAVSEAEYATWLTKAKQQFAEAGATPPRGLQKVGHKPAIRVALRE